MSTPNQLTGGAFQTALGNPLANGYLVLELSQDAQVNGSTLIVAGYKVTINLNSSGNVVTSPAQSVWANDVLSPAGTFYIVTAYTASGQLVWGPNPQQVLSSPSPFNIGAWVPASVNVGLGGNSGGFPATSVVNDIASFVNTTGGLQDSGIDVNDVVLLTSNNQFGNTTNTFGLTGSGEVQITPGGVLGISPGLSNVFNLDTTTGIGTFASLHLNQTPAASSTASDHSIPINLNGTTYYIRLSTTP